MNKAGRLHFVHAALATLVIVSGLLLFSQSLRGPLADLRIYLRDVHLVFGGLFVLTAFVYVRRLAADWPECAGLSCRRLLSLACLLLAAGAALSGLALVLRTDLAPYISQAALTLHRAIAVIGIAALIYHVVAALSRPPAAADADTGETARTDRRAFIRWTAATGALIGGVLTGRWFFGAPAGDGATPRRLTYKNCNVMTPEPTPSLGSQPPIGGGYKGNFEVFTVTPIPCANSDSWRFRLEGLVDNPRTFTWQEFLEIPRRVQVSDFYCITGWTVRNATYEGVALSRLLALGGVKPAARYAKFHSDDGVYTSALSLAQAMMEDVMIVLLMDGKPIPSDLGGPARLIVPKMYAYKGVKWVNAVELIDLPHIGYWESRGYDNDAWVPGLKAK